MQIRLIHNEEIEKIKWDSCIHYSNNGNVFGYRWFLNNVSKDWYALIEGDYVSVMPLFWKKDKLGSCNTLITPPLIRHAGLYSTSVLSTHRLKLFLNAIPPEYQSVNIRLNEQNYLPEAPCGYQLRERKNFQLMLSSDYPTLASRYTPDLKASISNAHDQKFKPATNIKPEQIARFIREHSPGHQNAEACFHASQRLMYNVMHRGAGFASALLDADDKLVATAFLVYSHSRILNLISAATPAARKDGALDLLYDLVVRTHAGRPLLLDFNTGENWPENFGAEDSVFAEISKDNRNWWKKIF